MGSRRGVLAQEDMAEGLRTRLALRKVKKAGLVVSRHILLFFFSITGNSPVLVLRPGTA